MGRKKRKEVKEEADNEDYDPFAADDDSPKANGNATSGQRQSRWGPDNEAKRRKIEDTTSMQPPWPPLPPPPLAMLPPPPPPPSSDAPPPPPESPPPPPPPAATAEAAEAAATGTDRGLNHQPSDTTSLPKADGSDKASGKSGSSTSSKFSEAALKFRAKVKKVVHKCTLPFLKKGKIASEKDQERLCKKLVHKIMQKEHGNTEFKNNETPKKINKYIVAYFKKHKRYEHAE